MSNRTSIVAPGVVPVIKIKTAYASIHGVQPGDVLPACLSFYDKKAHFNDAARRGDWDGKVELFSGRQFPAGLAWRVAEHLNDIGVEVRIQESVDAEDVDLQYFSDEYLSRPDIPNFRLHDHQMRAITAALTHQRGVIDSPTGSGKTEMMAAVARYLWEDRGYRSLIIAPKKGVARQTRERFQLYYGDDITVGYAAEGQRIEGPITIATGQTMMLWKMRRVRKRLVPADQFLRALVKDCQVLMYDECHRTSSATWYDLGLSSNALRRYGWSGTPLKENALDDAKLIGVTGPIICSIKPTELIGLKLAAKPKICFVMATNASGPDLDSKLPYDQAYLRGVVECDAHNAAVLRATEWVVTRGKQTLVLCRRKEQFARLHAGLEALGIPFIAVWGDSHNEERAQAKRSFSAGTVKVVLATTIWDEGEHVDGVDAIVLAEGVKANTNALQRIGRGMRPDSDDVWVVDFVPLCHDKLIDHASERARAYEKHGYEVRILEDWSLDESGFEELLPFGNWE